MGMTSRAGIMAGAIAAASSARAGDELPRYLSIVAVLGTNTDRNEADAKFVVDAMGLKYATLRAEGIPEKYGVQGFPTLILIDSEGKVRDVHVGYSPTLRADLTREIEGLLPPK